MLRKIHSQCSYSNMLKRTLMFNQNSELGIGCRRIDFFIFIPFDLSWLAVSHQVMYRLLLTVRHIYTHLHCSACFLLQLIDVFVFSQTCVPGVRYQPHDVMLYI